MALSPIIEEFIEKSPLTVMAQALISRMLDKETLNQWFDENASGQYTRDLLFSTIFDLMLSVVCKQKQSVCEAYRHSEEEINVSLTAVYNKLIGISTETSANLVKTIAEKCAVIIKNLNGERPELLEGFRIKMLDGNCIEKTHHRLEVLRNQSPGPLPGKSLVVFSPSLGLVIDVFPCEDGHAQERSLMPKVLRTVEKDDLWIADRNFCTINTMLSIADSHAFFLIRQHKQTPYEEIDQLKYVGKSESGKVYEQNIVISDSEGHSIEARRIVVKLKSSTRNGDTELTILTNLPKETVNAKRIAFLYRKRWTIETSFQHLEKNLNSEINALGYPKAALFGFCMALVASNLFEVIYGSLRGLYGHEEIDENFSTYYATSEMASIHPGMMIIVPDSDWDSLCKMQEVDFIIFILKCADKINLHTYRKNKRGPKKPPPKKINQGEPHVSTYKLLLERKKKSMTAH